MSLKDPNVVNRKHRKRVAIVLANPAVSAATGWPVGFWWSELTHPYLVLTEAGYEIEIFSPRMSRMHEDAQLGGDAMLKWLVAAYEIGLSEGRGSVSRQADAASE